jgi:hypothetical protein
VIVRIARADLPNGVPLPISRKEWRDCYQADPEFRADGEDSISWSGLREGEFCLLVWRDGRIEALDPPPELEQKMAEVAYKLHATITTHEKLHEQYVAKTQARRGPTYMDPLTWHMVAYGVAGFLLIAAAAMLLILTH